MKFFNFPEENKRRQKINAPDPTVLPCRDTASERRVKIGLQASLFSQNARSVLKSIQIKSPLLEIHKLGLKFH